MLKLGRTRSLALSLGVLFLVLLWAGGTSKHDDACDPSLFTRVQATRLFTPFDAEALVEGTATYSERVVLKGTSNKVHVKTERRYLGPFPSPQELECFLQNGMADAFHHLLKDEHKRQLSAHIQPLESELGMLAQELDLEIHKALLSLPESPDEILVKRTDPQSESKRRKAQTLARNANSSIERYVHVAKDDANAWFRIRKARFPRVFQLQDGQEETRSLRDRFLESQVREIFVLHGLAALEPARWAVPEVTR